MARHQIGNEDQLFSRARRYLLTWARRKAHRIAMARNLPNPPGGTIADYCREMQVDRCTFNRTMDRCCNPYSPIGGTSTEESALTFFLCFERYHYRHAQFQIFIRLLVFGFARRADCR